MTSASAACKGDWPCARAAKGCVREFLVRERENEGGSVLICARAMMMHTPKMILPVRRVRFFSEGILIHFWRGIGELDRTSRKSGNRVRRFFYC